MWCARGALCSSRTHVYGRPTCLLRLRRQNLLCQWKLPEAAVLKDREVFARRQSALAIVGESAPEIAAALLWFNSDALTLQQCRGRPFALLFFSAGCVHGEAALDVFERVAAEHNVRDSGCALNMVAVHGPRFAGQRDPEHIKHALRFRKRTIPVVHDVERRVWRDYAVDRGPVVVLVCSEGTIAATHHGEVSEELLRSHLGGKTEEGQAPVGESLVEHSERPVDGHQLRYPTRVLVDGDQLFVSDTGNQSGDSSDGR